MSGHDRKTETPVYTMMYWPVSTFTLPPGVTIP